MAVTRQGRWTWSAVSRTARDLRTRIARWHVPLAVNLFTIMLTMTLAVVLALTAFTYVKGREVAEATGRALSRELTAKVAHRVETLFAPASVMATLSSSLPEVAQPPDLLIHPMGWYIMRALEANETLYSAYMGFEDGSFYQIIAVPDDPQTPEEKQLRADTVRLTHGAPPGTRFVHRAILKRPDANRLQVWTFLDRSRLLLGSRIDPAPNYDPRVRPWYGEALSARGTVMTDIYTFASLGFPGITVAHPFDGDLPGVFAVDLTLASVAEFLAAQDLSPNGRLLVATSTGQVLAFRDRDRLRTGDEYVRGRPLALGDLDDPGIVRALFAAGADEDVQLVELAQTGEPMLVRRVSVPMPGTRDLVVAMAAPLSDYTGPVDDLIGNSLIFALLVALLGVPILGLLARRMSRALGVLADDAEHIRTLDLDNPARVQTMVKEIHDLAGAQRTMKESLRTFGLFVPKDLVRQIMAAGGSAEPGGTRRELSLLFTDIADFTTISESTPPEDLMVRVSLYFEEMTKAITGQGGTIDKFIGDAVMAIWNAPQPCENHPERACLAALEGRRLIRSFNSDLEANGYPAFHTRFGVHVGDVVVGNVGSSDRMNFSAIGAAVNTASRIEGLNKIFGTEILVSDAVAARVADRFVLREVDVVRPKGVTTPLWVHELLGLHPRAAHLASLPPVDPGTVAYVACWNEAQTLLRRRRNWTAARDAFDALAHERPDDPLAAYFRDLSAHLARDPEGAARWDEVRRMDRK